MTPPVPHVTSASKDRRASCARGSITVEMVFVVPLYVLLWLLANHAFILYVNVINSVATVRACAWQFAASGCKNAPPACAVRGPTPGLPPDGPSFSNLEQVASSFEPLSASLLGPYDNALVTEKIVSIPAPPALGFRPVRLKSDYGVMCDDRPTVSWTVLSVFEANCPLLGKFCL